MWRILAEVVVGTSHGRTKQPCQDRAHVVPIDVRGELILIAACADGAGSAAYSEVGADLAVRRSIELVVADISEGLELEGITCDVMLGWFTQARHAVEQEATARNVSPNELACTLLLAVVGRDHAAFGQVGDGAIVVGDGTDFDAVFWPQQGEYANVTNFLTSTRLDATLEFSSRGASRAVALFTDGLQGLTLEFASRIPHQRFFQGMFRQLASSEVSEDLVAPLRAFLDSAVVNERTDDDKTLILAWKGDGHAAPVAS